MYQYIENGHPYQSPLKMTIQFKSDPKLLQLEGNNLTLKKKKQSTSIYEFPVAD